MRYYYITYFDSYDETDGTSTSFPTTTAISETELQLYTNCKIIDKEEITAEAYYEYWYGEGDRYNEDN